MSDTKISRDELLELTKALLHPKKGFTSEINENLKSYEDWEIFLKDRDSWVMFTTNKNMANILDKQKIGEVIPDDISNLDIYNSCFCCSIISEFLEIQKSLG